MLDIKFIRENSEKVKQGCEKKQVNINIDQILATDKKKRNCLKQIEELRAEQNKISEQQTPKELLRNPTGQTLNTEQFKKAKEIKEKIKKIDPALEEVEKKLQNLLFQIPNLPSDDTPIGKNENKNVVLRKIGDIPKFDFKPKDHLELGKTLDIIDIERATKVSGTRFYYLKNEAVLLEFALANLAFDILLKENFVPIIPPVMIKEKPYLGMGRLAPCDKEERYYMPKDKLYLVGSAEHTIGPMHMNEIFMEKNLPKRYIGFSSCLRREAGSYGKDTRGILRSHQFDKVEMFSFTTPEKSEQEHIFLLSLQEKLMQELKLPYQVVFICTGDMGFTDAKQYDIETWLPGQQKYRETHSCSNTTNFQARGINCRYRKKDSSLDFVHMLNATGFAMGRTLIAIIENYQQKNGSIIIPEVLRKYMNGKSEINNQNTI